MRPNREIRRASNEWMWEKDHGPNQQQVQVLAQQQGLGQQQVIDWQQQGLGQQQVIDWQQQGLGQQQQGAYGITVTSSAAPQTSTYYTASAIGSGG